MFWNNHPEIGNVWIFPHPVASKCGRGTASTYSEIYVDTGVRGNLETWGRRSRKWTENRKVGTSLIHNIKT